MTKRLYSLYQTKRGYGVTKDVHTRVPGAPAYTLDTARRVFQDALIYSAFSESPRCLRAIPKSEYPK